MNYYEILGLNKNCSKKDIKKKYKTLAKLYHPDKGGDPEKFKKISQAYTILYDDETRNKYDNNYNLEIYETYVNPFDLFEEIIRKSDIVMVESKINNWLYNDFDIEDEINDSVFINKKDNYSHSIQTNIIIKDNKKYTKTILNENGIEKVIENVLDLNSNNISF